MARLLPSLAILAILVAAETLARSLKNADPSVRDVLKAALSRRNKGYGYGYGYPYGHIFGKSAVDSCPDGGIQLTATNLPQSFAVLEYTNNLDCTWNITADEGMVIMVEIEEYEIENAWMCQYDYLSVGAGDGSSVHLCGEGSFSGYSVGNHLDLHFHTDYCVTHNGFTVEFIQIPAEDAPVRYTMQDAVDDSGITLTETEEFVLTSHAGLAYENNMNYTTTVTAPRGKMVLLTVEAFDVEYSYNCIYDFVSIYNSHGDLVNTWCGSNANGNEAVSLNNMTIWFHTDDSVTATGFILKLSVIEPSSLMPFELPTYEARACPGPIELDDVTDRPVVIASPMFGMSQYSNEMNCSWKVTTAPGKFLKVKVIDLDIEFHGSCEWDSLSFLDGPATSNLLAKLCGNTEPAEFTSSGSDLLINFVTDSCVTDLGFMLEVSAVDEEIIVPEDPCSALGGAMHVTEEAAEIASPGGLQDNYLPNSNCSWVITSPDADKTVTFTFNSFALENAPGCMYDSLSFYNSETADPESLIGTYCGETSPESITSTGSVLFINFVSDYCVQHEGFSGVVSFGNDEPTEPQTPSSDFSWWYGDWESSSSSSESSESSSSEGSGFGETGDENDSTPSVSILPVKTTKMVDWSSPATAKKANDEAAMKRDFAEVLRKGAQHSRKLVEFFRAVRPQNRPLFTTLAIAVATGAATATGSNVVNTFWSWG